MRPGRQGIRSRDRLTILWGYCPPEVRSALRPILLRYLWLVPSWVQTLHVGWDDSPDNANANMATSAQPEYRQGQLTVSPGWLGAVPAARRTDVIHELLHFPLAPVVIEHRDLTARLLDDGGAPQFHGYAQEQWRRVFEGCVQDLAAAIGLMPGPFPTVPYVEVEDDDA